jgi:hypothetical protein
MTSLVPCLLSLLFYSFFDVLIRSCVRSVSEGDVEYTDCEVLDDRCWNNDVKMLSNALNKYVGFWRYTCFYTLYEGKCSHAERIHLI